MSAGDGDKSSAQRKGRSNYFQTEFIVSVKKDHNGGRSSNTGFDDKKKVSISIQTANSSMVGAEESLDEHKKWVRPPVVGQASSGSDSQVSGVPVLNESDSASDDEIIDSSQEPLTSSNYPTRKDYLSEKAPEGSPSQAGENRAPSPASASSLTSGRPLEWDSGADVGYFKDYQVVGGADQLSSLERMALGGSASLLTRSDPEGTVSNSAPLPPMPAATSTNTNTNQDQTLVQTSIGPPNAESTPFQSSKSSMMGNSSKPGIPSHLFPEVIVKTTGLSCDSDSESVTSRRRSPVADEVPKRSTSLEDIAASARNAPFARSQSQNNVNFDMNAHLVKLVQPQSNSSSSVATVVKGSQKTHSSDKKESESGSGADGRAHSFEYLPGEAYESAQRDAPTGKNSLTNDIERGVKLLTDFMKGTNANDTLTKKKLLKKVVNELLSNKYSGEESWSSSSIRERGSGDWDGTASVPNPPSTWQGLPSVSKEGEHSKPHGLNSWPLDAGEDRCVTRRGHSKEMGRSEISGESASQGSLLVRMKQDRKPAGTSGSTLTSSSVTEPSIKQHTNPVPGVGRRILEPKHPEPGKPEPSSSSSFTSWKIPTAKSGRILEMLNRKRLQKEASQKPVDREIISFFDCERENQLEWIKKEIDHLSNLKRLLEMHESLRKNFNHLKKTKDTEEDFPRPADHKTVRPKRQSVRNVASAPSNTRTAREDEQLSVNSWNSHNYGGHQTGVLKKNASTNTVASKSEAVSTVKKPLSYTIIFEAEKKGKENGPTPVSSGTSASAQAFSNPPGLVIVDRDTLMKESRERIRAQFGGNLQDELMTNNPDYIARAEMRRQTVADIAAMREVRVKNRTKILTAAVNGDPVPQIPNPLAVKRVVSQKVMRKLTEKNYKKSSLVKKQAHERKKKEDMATNRLMAEMFNRNLQNRILKGQTYLSNSVSVL